MVSVMILYLAKRLTALPFIATLATLAAGIRGRSGAQPRPVVSLNQAASVNHQNGSGRRIAPGPANYHCPKGLEMQSGRGGTSFATAASSC
jgi:hypothetical protein